MYTTDIEAIYQSQKNANELPRWAKNERLEYCEQAIETGMVHQRVFQTGGRLHGQRHISQALHNPGILKWLHYIYALYRGEKPVRTQR